MNVRAPPVPMVQAATPQRPSPFDGVFAVRVWVDAIAVVGACYVAVKLWDSPGDGYTSAAEILCGATTVFVQFAGGAPYNLYAARVRSASVLFALVWLLRFVAGQSWYNDGAPIPESGVVAWLVGIASWGLACASLWKALPLHPMRSPDARKLEGKAHAWAVIPALLVLWFASASPPHVSAGMMSAPPVQPAQPALVAAAVQLQQPTQKLRASATAAAAAALMASAAAAAQTPPPPPPTLPLPLASAATSDLQFRLPIQAAVYFGLVAALLCAKTQSSDAALFLGATAWMLTAPLGFVALGGTLMLAGVLYVAWIFAAGASDPAPPAPVAPIQLIPVAPGPPPAAPAPQPSPVPAHLLPSRPQAQVQAQPQAQTRQMPVPPSLPPPQLPQLSPQFDAGPAKQKFSVAMPGRRSSSGFGSSKSSRGTRGNGVVVVMPAWASAPSPADADAPEDTARDAATVRNPADTWGFVGPDPHALPRAASPTAAVSAPPLATSAQQPQQNSAYEEPDVGAITFISASASSLGSDALSGGVNGGNGGVDEESVLRLFGA